MSDGYYVTELKARLAAAVARAETAEALVTQLRDATQEALDIQGDVLAANRVLVAERDRYKDALQALYDAYGNVGKTTSEEYAQAWVLTKSALAAAVPVVPEEA